MSGNVTDPTTGIVGETAVRKRGRPKKVRINDDGVAESKRRKVDVNGSSAEMSLSNASSIEIPVEKTVEQNSVGSRDQTSLVSQQQPQQRNLVAMKSKRHAIPGGSEGELAALRTDLSTHTDISEASMKRGAWEVVLQVHGICIGAKAGAAIFPGEAGQEVGGGIILCSCCRQPEIKRQTIICDACEQSFHISCVKLSSESANALDDWTCPFCAVAFNVSRSPRGFSTFAQKCLDKKLGRSASNQVAQEGRAKMPQDDHERKLDLNLPAESHEGLDEMLTENGPTDQIFGQQPSADSQTFRSNLRESCQEGKLITLQFSTANPLDIISGNVPKVSDVEQLLSLESLAAKVFKRNGEVPEFNLSEKVIESLESSPSQKREAGVTATDRKLPTGTEESGTVTGRKLEKSPEKLRIVSKELGKVITGKAPDLMKELAGIGGIRASATAGLLLQADESRLLDPTGKFVAMRESKKFSFSSALRRSDDISERPSKPNDCKTVDTSAGTCPRSLLNTPLKAPASALVNTFNGPAQQGICEKFKISFQHQAGDERKPVASLHQEGTTRSPEKGLASRQTPSSEQFLLTMTGFGPGNDNRVDLTGLVPSEPNGQYPLVINYVDLTGVVHDSLQGQNSEAFIEEPSGSSAEDQQLRKVGEEALQQLKDVINEKHGLFLADGWEVEVRKRKSERHLDKYFISPEKQRFRSRLEVMRHLGLSDGPKRKSELQQSQLKDWSSMVQKVAKGKDKLQLPFKYGDVVIESLGVVDVRPGFRNELQIWPVGYRSTWHDSTSASFCISEVVDCGTSAPAFCVTRRFCPIHLVFSNETAGAGKTRYRTDVYVSEKGAGKRSCGITREETNPFSSQPLFKRCQGLQPHCGSVSDREDRESLNALLGGLGELTFEQESSEAWELLQARDAIGEFTVEGSSTVQAWKLFAEEFVQRCRRTPWVLDLLPYICPHSKLESLSSQPVASETPAIDQSPNSQYAGLLEKLGEDRFGLSETLVKGMIEALPNAGNCTGYKSLEQRGLCWKENDAFTNPPPQSRFRAREKARKHRRVPDLLSEEQNGLVEMAEDTTKDKVVVAHPVRQRPPPPAGEPIGRRLPPELVGDVLQIWEFLCRFGDVIGNAEPPLLEDLEEGLICEKATMQNNVVRSCSCDGKGGNIKPDSDTILMSSGDVDVLTTGLGNSNGDLNRSSKALTNLPPSSHRNGSLFSPGSQELVRDGVQEQHEEDDRNLVTGNLHVPASPVDGVKPDQFKGEVLGGDTCKSQCTKLLISSGFSAAGSVHIPLMNYLLSDLQAKVCGPDDVPGENEERPSKRGRKRVRDTVLRPILGREKLSESFSVNEWTWPEIARRYVISVSSVPKMGENAEDNTEECLKVLRCIQGDGGVLCGALDGVAGMEVDAQLLAEAEKELSNGCQDNADSQMPNTPPAATAKDAIEGGKGHDGSEETASWVKILDPIAKLPTNVGSRIRNRVRDALEAAPPDWAVELLEQSISKEVYKGNASGPTKRIVMDVLSRYRGEDPKTKKSKKLRKRVVPSPEVVMQRCRIALRQVAAADKGRIVSTGIGTIITNFYESEGEGLLARPLDFRCIDLRLGAGAYGTSPAAFAADVRQIWKNVSSVYGSDSEESKATAALSQLFESLYTKQVVIFQGGVENAAAFAVDGKNTGSSGELTVQNSTGEQQDAGETVKAPWEDDSCRICGIDDDHDNVLLCDDCDAEYHIYCLNPPLPEVPEGNWYCSSCIAVDKGFLELPSIANALTETKAQEKQVGEDQHKLEGSEDVLDKKYLRSGAISEGLAWPGLAMKLADTDYWHLSLAERLCLLRFLCDQALETLKIRIHLEETMDLATEQQSKLRHLLTERRRHAELHEVQLDNSKEVKTACVVQAGAAKIKRLHLELGNQTVTNTDLSQKVNSEASGTVETDQKELLGSEQHVPSVGVTLKDMTLRGTASVQSIVHDGPLLKNQNKDDCGQEDSLKYNSVFDATEIDSTVHPGSCGPLEGSAEKLIYVLDDRNRLSDSSVPANETQRNEYSSVGFHNEEAGRDPQVVTNAQISGAEVGKVSLPRGLTSPLDAEITRAIAKLMNVNIRRDLLGRDDHGREYWALFGCMETPWLAVEVVDSNCCSETKDRPRVVADMAKERKSGNATFSPHLLGDLDSDEADRNPGQIHHDKCAIQSVEGEEAQKIPEEHHRWFVYSTTEVLDQLIGWLSSSSSQEKSLKSLLLQWKGFLFIHTGGEGEQPEGPLKVSSRQEVNAPNVNIIQTSENNIDLVSQNLGVTQIRHTTAVPILRATRLLEWKYGPFGNPMLSNACPPVPAKRGRKKKTQATAELARCKCLEPLWVSRYHCIFCHLTFESAVDFEIHSRGMCFAIEGDDFAEEDGEKKTGEKGSLVGQGGPSNKAPGIAILDQLSGNIALPPVPSTMPFIVHDSNLDRINQIGLIKDKVPTFAPGLSVAPAFDPSLMILDSVVEWPSSSPEGVSGTRQELLNSLAVGGTYCLGHGNCEHQIMPPWVLIKSSADLPRMLDSTSEVDGVSIAPLNPLGVSIIPLGSSRDNKDIEELHSSVSMAPPAIGNSDHLLPLRPKSGGRLFQVTGKQLVISEASLLPLKDEDVDLLEQLKMHLLDIESVLSFNMLELERASSSRRQAWRSLVKSAKSIYKMIQATILLEQMVRADFLRSSWGYWSSFSAAAKTATISSLFLRVYALDAAILYDNWEKYTGPEISPFEMKHGKREKEEKKKVNHSMKVGQRRGGKKMELVEQ